MTAWRSLGQALLFRHRRGEQRKGPKPQERHEVNKSALPRPRRHPRFNFAAVVSVHPSRARGHVVSLPGG